MCHLEGIQRQAGRHYIEEEVLIFLSIENSKCRIPSHMEKGMLPPCSPTLRVTLTFRTNGPRNDLSEPHLCRGESLQVCASLSMTLLAAFMLMFDTTEVGLGFFMHTP